MSTPTSVRSAVSTFAVFSTTVLVSAGALAAPAGATLSGGDKPFTTATVQLGERAPGGGSWQQLLAAQDRLVASADRISEAARASRSGFAGISVSPEQRSLQVFLKGTPSARVQSVLAEVRRDVTVTVSRARHSETELARAAQQIAAEAGGSLSSIAPKTDGSGLTATIAGASTIKARGLLRDATVPVQLEGSASPALASRWNDSPPWYGGSAWRNATRGGGCSTGFAVQHGGRTKMLTAGHCAALGDRATDPTGEHMGYVSNDSNAYDVQLIDARSAGRVFNSTATLSEFTNAVIGTRGSYVGMYVCTSGAYSGTRCNVQVKQTGVSINIGYWVFNTVRAERTDFTNAVGQGDSGGAVEVVAADTSKVYAAGVNTAIDTSTRVACTGYVTTNRTCAWRMYYAPWSSVASLFGASIVLG